MSLSILPKRCTAAKILCIALLFGAAIYLSTDLPLVSAIVKLYRNNSIVILHGVSNTTNDTDNEPKVQFPKPVFMLKTHKTGGSVIQNILMRHAMLSNLTVGLAGHGADWSRFCMRKPFDLGCTCNADQQPFDIICHHMQYNRDQVKAAMGKCKYY